jgi:hypothetical protein
MTELNISEPQEDHVERWWNAVVTGNVDQKDLYCLRGNAVGETAIQSTVTIHRGQSILFPVINTFSDLYDVAVIDADVKADIDATSSKSASIDGEELKEQQIFRVNKVPFDLVVPTGGFQIGQLIIGAGSNKVGSDGYWVLISPRSKDNRCLDAGQHKISFNGKSKRGFHTAASYSVTQL